MKKYIYKFAKSYSLAFRLSKEKEKELIYSNCEYCNKYTNPSKKTYQNVGLHNWKRGFVDKNVFPLCKECYIMRNGMNKKELFKAIHNILFRLPVMQVMVYHNPKYCKKYNKVKFCRKGRCAYCHSKKNLSIDRIDSKKRYTLTNIQTLCWTCNRMKSDLKEDIFFNHIKRLFYSSLKLSMSK